MSRLALFLLGPPRVELDSAPVEIDRRKAIALLAYLAVSAEPHGRDALATLFWPAYDQSRARAALRRTLSALNKANLGPWLDVDRQTVSLKQDAGLWVDVTQFRQHLASCLASEGAPCTTYQPLLTEAVSLYHADFMAGFTLRDSPNFDEWQFFQTENLRHDLSSALDYLVRCHSSQGELEIAIDYARRWLALDPLYELVHRQLMHLYARNDQRTVALRQYQECARLLKQELGVQPTIETRTLYQEIQRGAIAQRQGGQKEHFSHSLYRAAPMHNFPAQSTPFIGRQVDLSEITNRLQNPNCQLLTLIGPGGIGKTRLAIQAAIEDRTSFADGLYFVPLASIRSPDFLVPAIADSLNLALDGQEDPHPQLLNHLQQKHMLLVLDNFEHLVKKIDLLPDILSQAPAVKILTTSRERLHLQGEWTFEVKGMTYPEDEKVSDIENYNAAALFLQRAYRVHSDFSPTEAEKPHIIRICQLVEGMPLGIELAAAWVRVLSCREIAQEIERMVNLHHNLDFLSTSLQDVPKRHRSIQAVFDHSWQLLSAEEKRVFKKLSVFRRGCRREAIERVTGATLPLLSALVDKSLLARSGSGRYEMHELLQQYAAEKLRQEPLKAEAVQNRHCEYYATFLRQREDLMKGAKQEEILAEIGEEIENVRSSWRWAVRQKNSREIERTLKSLARFCSMYSRFQEGVDLFGKAITELKEANPNQNAKLIGQLLAYQGWFLLRQGLYAQAGTLLQESASIFQHLEDQANLAIPVQFSGILASEVGAYEQAKRRLEESLVIFREIGDQWEVAWTLSHLGYCISKLEDGERLAAKQLLKESLAIYQALGGKQGISIVLSNLGYVTYRSGDYDEAKRLLEESLALRREIGYPRGIAVTLNNLGHVTSALEEYQTCKRYYHESLRIALRIQAIPLALGALEGLAGPLFNEGKKALALDLSALTLHHPASNKETRNKALRFLSAAKPDLPPDMKPPIEISTTDYAGKFERLVAKILAEEVKA